MPVAALPPISKRTRSRVRSAALLTGAIALAGSLAACSNLTSTALSPSESPTTAGSTTEVLVQVDKYGCEATPSQVPQGAVDFKMINSSDAVATLQIAAPKDGQWTTIVADSTYLRPHKTATQTATLTPGPYAVLCGTEAGEDMTRITAV